jgi:hypothetical protein
MSHIPNILNFEDFENLIAVLNYAEFSLVVNPARYSSPSPVSFQQPLYKLPRERARQMRRWLEANLILELDPPVDGENTSLRDLMLKSLVGQAHTLLDSVQRSDELGVLGAAYQKGTEEKFITGNQVLQAIRHDLFSFPGFRKFWEEELSHPAPELYSWPDPPKPSRYIMKLKSSVDRS